MRVPLRSQSQQAGLLAYRDDGDYVKLVAAAAGGRVQLRLVSEAGDAVAGSAPAATTPRPRSDTYRLRLARSGSRYTGWWSLDGRSWRRLGAVVNRKTRCAGGLRPASRSGRAVSGRAALRGVRALSLGLRNERRRYGSVANLRACLSGGMRTTFQARPTRSSSQISQPPGSISVRGARETPRWETRDGCCATTRRTRSRRATTRSSTRHSPRSGGGPRSDRSS